MEIIYIGIDIDIDLCKEYMNNIIRNSLLIIDDPCKKNGIDSEKYTHPGSEGCLES